MKASPRQQRLLLDLQELDNTTARLRRRRSQLPERTELDALRGEATAVRERFMAAQRELDTQRAELERVESDVNLVVQRRSRDTALLEASTSSKEAQALQSELDTLAQRQSMLEDRQLEMMEAAESAQNVFDDAERELAGIDRRRADLEQKLADAEQRVDRELRSAAEERDGVAAELQRDVLDLYEETRARIGIGAARLRGNVSEGSNIALAPGELADIRAAAPDEIVFCPQSGTILIREEG